MPQPPNDPTARLALPCLLALTDRRLLTPQWTLAQAIAPAVTGGANLVVLREADLPDTPRSTVARFVRDGVRGRVPLLLSGSPELAARADGVDGVHVEVSDDVAEAVAAARSVLGVDRLVGASVRSASEASAAAAAGADYVLVEYDWSTPERIPDHMAGVCRATSAPVLAGTDPPLASVVALTAAGAAGVAVCAAAMSAPDRAAACAAYWLALSVVESPPRHSLNSMAE